MQAADPSVVIVGGGPFGLMLANELGRRSIPVALFARAANQLVSTLSGSWSAAGAIFGRLTGHG
jgi:2-polyprenyl-6-methoxyphenol hydroxylase-like FAD-dependent oxidoreductase